MRPEGDRDRCGPAEPGELGPAAQPVRVVSGGDQQLPGGVDLDPGQCDQLRGDSRYQHGQVRIEFVDLCLQSLPTAGQG